MNDQPLTKSRCVLYARSSTFEQQNSTAAQLRQLRGYADAMGYEVIKEYDEHLSAEGMESRPLLQEAFGLVESGQVDVFIISKIDRLSRNTKDFLNAIDRYFTSDKKRKKKKSATLVSVSDSLDFSTPGGMLVASILSVIASWELSTIRERTRVALCEIRRQGRKTGGAPRFGWNADERGFLSRNEEEQKAIETVVELRQKGVSLRSIAKHLNSAGYRTKKGKAFSQASIVRILNLVEVA